MFSGIIQSIGSISHLERHDKDARYTIETGDLDISDVAVGHSMATQGVCLTVVELGADYYVADVSFETLACTTLGNWAVGQSVNLEKSATPDTYLGGHLLSGHVDGVGQLVSRQVLGRGECFCVSVPAALVKYIAVKGSIAIDGISLTVNAIRDRQIDLQLIPHTLAATTMSQCTPGDKVNIEVDLVARYLERLMAAR